METSLIKYELFSREECIDIINHVETDDKIWNKLNKPTIFSKQMSPAVWYNRRVTEWISTQFNLTEEMISKGYSATCFKYHTNSIFEEHIDTLDFMEFRPIYNVNVVLNDDFDGGKFFINKVEYDTQAGYIYKYPSSNSHGVTRVNNGIRYVLGYLVYSTDLISPSKVLI
jgi:hypothetical protein